MTDKKWPKMAIKYKIVARGDAGDSNAQFAGFINLFPTFVESFSDLDDDYKNSFVDRANALFSEYDAGSALSDSGVEEISDLSSNLDEEQLKVLMDFLIEEGVVDIET